jgi:hypothetical protein
MAPSATAAETRLVARWRTSPAANTPGKLVSRGKGARDSGHDGSARASRITFGPVRT